MALTWDGMEESYKAFCDRWHANQIRNDSRDAPTQLRTGTPERLPLATVVRTDDRPDPFQAAKARFQARQAEAPASRVVRNDYDNNSPYHPMNDPSVLAQRTVAAKCNGCNRLPIVSDADEDSLCTSHRYLTRPAVSSGRVSR
jgi:hypothetical protein